MGEIIAGELFQGLKTSVGIESTQEGLAGSPVDSVKLLLSKDLL
jgi:hypothetical protein